MDKIEEILAYNNEFLATNTPEIREAAKQIRQLIGQELLESLDASDGEYMFSNDAAKLIREVCRLGDE